MDSKFHPELAAVRTGAKPEGSDTLVTLLFAKTPVRVEECVHTHFLSASLGSPPPPHITQGIEHVCARVSSR